MKVAQGVYRTNKKRKGASFAIVWFDPRQTNPAKRRQRRTLARGTTKREAIRVQRAEQAAADAGRPSPFPGDVTFEEVWALKLADHAQHRRRRALHAPHLHGAFGGWRVAAIDTLALGKYVTTRQAADASNATITNELAALRHAMRLARNAKLIAEVPHFPMPKVQNVRRCYFTVPELDALLTLLPPIVRAPVEFAWLTGWRRGNVYALRFEHIDFKRGEVRVPGGLTKNGEPITTPFAHGARLAALLREQERAREGRDPVFVGLKLLRAAWRRAVGKQGLDKWGEQYDPRTGTVIQHRPRFHDLRHSFAQHMIDAGADEGTVMALGGWKGRAMLERYSIKTDTAKRRAVAQQVAYIEAERAAAAAERAKPRVIDITRQVMGR